MSHLQFFTHRLLFSFDFLVTCDTDDRNIALFVVVSPCGEERKRQCLQKTFMTHYCKFKV